MEKTIYEAKAKILPILRKSKLCRGNDLELYYQVLVNNGLPTDLKELKEMFTTNIFETISRSRRKAQEENPTLLPANELVNGRRKREERIRKAMRNV